MSGTIGKVLISDDIDGCCPEILRAGGIEVIQATKLPQADLIAKLQGVDGLIVRSATTVNADVLAGAGSLKVVGRAGTGVDNIDCAKAKELGIRVLNTPAGNSVSAAELTCSHILNLARHVPPAHATLKDGKWERKNFMGIEVDGKTLAIIGLGRIGLLVAQRMQAFGMITVGFDPLVSADDAAKYGVKWLSLDDIWPIADFITVHVPLIKGKTEGMVNTATLSKCKKGVRLVNVARGGILDEADVAKGLDDGTVAAVALDVYIEEPPKKPEHRILVDHPKVIVTPHLGASTKEAQRKVAEEIAENIVDMNKGLPPKGVVV